MLRLEQVEELLKRCQAATGRNLKQVIGNLRNAETRASAIWELLVIEAISNAGPIEYEPHPGRSPDVLLHLPVGRAIWVEASYLYPRFWQEERKSDEVINWIIQEAQSRGIAPYKIQCHYDGDRKCKSGPVRMLPGLNERRKFFQNPEVKEFFDRITRFPSDQFSFTSSQHSIALQYSPNAKGPFISSGGLLQESPKNFHEHAVYRKLKYKAKQHNVEGPRVVCLGSDQSPALSSLQFTSSREAVFQAFLKNRSLSAVIIVRIETHMAVFSPIDKQTHVDIYLNPNAHVPLTEEESEALGTLNFNRWKYTYQLSKWEEKGEQGWKRVSGPLTSKIGGFGVEFEVPANILIAALAGQTSLAKEYNLPENDQIAIAITEGWKVESMVIKNGDLEAGEAPKVVFCLSPLPDYYSRKKQVKS